MRVENLTTGEAVLEGESGREVRVVYDAQAVHMIESRLEGGASAFDLISGLRDHRPTLQVTAVIIVAGAAGYARRNGSRGKTLTPQAALDVIDDCGGQAEVLPVLSESMARSRTLGLVKEDEGLGPDDEAFGRDFEATAEGDARPPGPGNGHSETPRLQASHPGASGP